MPAPVEFTVSIASLPPGFSGDPQALATAIAERLTIEPSEPWSSFINGGAQPAADVGPFLFEGMEWRVWSDGLGTYTFHRQNGAGLVDATVPLAKLSDDTPNSALIYDADGRPVLTAGTQGQVLTAGATGLPAFANPATANYFWMQLSTQQDYTSDGTNKQIQFDTVAASNGITPDTALYRVPVTAGSVWHIGVSLQIIQINGTHTDVNHYIAFRPYQNSTLAIGSTDGYSAVQTRCGVQCSGIYAFANAGYVDAVIATTDNAAGVNHSIETNGTNTRFWGHRLL